MNDTREVLDLLLITSNAYTRKAEHMIESRIPSHLHIENHWLDSTHCKRTKHQSANSNTKLEGSFEGQTRVNVTWHSEQGIWHVLFIKVGACKSYFSKMLAIDDAMLETKESSSLVSIAIDEQCIEPALPKQKRRNMLPFVPNLFLLNQDPNCLKSRLKTMASTLQHMHDHDLAITYSTNDFSTKKPSFNSSISKKSLTIVTLLSDTIQTLSSTIKQGLGLPDQSDLRFNDTQTLRSFYRELYLSRWS